MYMTCGYGVWQNAQAQPLVHPVWYLSMVVELSFRGPHVYLPLQMFAIGWHKG